jgi:hypothetical protein
MGGGAQATRVVVASYGLTTTMTSPTKLWYYMAGCGRGGPIIIPHAGGSGGGHNSPPVPAPPRCGAVPPALPPGRADGDNGDHGACAAARSNAGDGDHLGNDDTATTAVAGKADNAGQENDNRGSDDGDDDKNNDKCGRGAYFNSSSSLSSLFVGHLISDAIAAAGSLLSVIEVPRIDVQHCNSLRPRRRRTSSGITKR